MHFFVFVVPIKNNADVPASCPISAHLVVLCDDSLKMLGVFTPEVFYSKFVDDKGELDWSPFVHPQSRDKFALKVTIFIETFFKQFV